MSKQVRRGKQGRQTGKYLHTDGVREELDDERDADVRHREVLQHQLAVARSEAVSEVWQALRSNCRR